MTTEENRKGYKERLEDFIALGKSRKNAQFEVNLRKQIVKQSIIPEETDNLKVEKNLYLLMADFALVGLGDERRTVTKIYAFGDINETGVEEKVIRIIANERLKMDYQRLQDAKIDFQKKFF
jgi:hypothetical protein